MAKVPLAFEPGTHWLYGFSSELTAALIEAVCGKGIDEVFRELIFDPLGMDNTRSRYFGDAQSRMVTLYARGKDGALVPGATKLDEKHLPGEEHEAGWARLFSNVNDYSKLMTALACGGEYRGVHLIGRKTIDLMRANGLSAEQLKDFEDPYLQGYGYGYGVRTLLDRGRGDNNATPGTFGWTGGFGTWAEADPAEEVSVVYMHNLMPDEERFFHPRMRAAAFGCLD
jgi:CubicO group peptidase (beta-lactamase class C family)